MIRTVNPETNFNLPDTQKRKNAVFIVVDTLRYDYLGCNGFRPSPSPTMDYLITNGLSANNMFSVGCPTQMSMPGIFTSTYPLDKGGYNQYIRDDFIGEVFKKAGYATYMSWCSVIAKPNENYSIFKGIEKIYKGGSLDNVVIALDTTINRHLANLSRYNTETKIDKCVEMLEPFFTVMLEVIKSLCQEKLKDIKTDNNSKSIIIDDCEWNYQEIYDRALKEEERYLVDTKGYLKKLVQERTSIFYKALIFVDKCTNKLFGKTVSWKIRKEKDLFGLILSKKSAVLRKHKQRFCEIKRKLKLEERNISFPLLNFNEASAALHIDNLIEWIDEQDKKNFFAYVQLNDTHPPCNFISYDSHNLDLDEEWGCLKEFFDKLRINKEQNLKDHLRYLFSIKYVDNQIKRLIDYLTMRNLLDDTVVVLTSDHGTHYPGLPYRDDAHVTKSFYDEFYHIPISFFNKDIKPKKLDGLFSSIDMVPTLLDLLGLSSPSSFKGRPFNKKEFDGREFVLVENMGPGYCDFEVKPITVCIRNKTHKIVFEMPPLKEKKSGFVKELFDLVNDPGEEMNLANNAVALKKVQGLVEIAEERIKEIYRQIKLPLMANDFKDEI
jgi:hypothetical protein